VLECLHEKSRLSFVPSFDCFAAFATLLDDLSFGRLRLLRISIRVGRRSGLARFLAAGVRQYGMQ